MHRALATRHLSSSPGPHQMLHDRLNGRITTDQQGGVQLVVDGIALEMDDFAAILASHEGWTFELRIVDPVE